MNLPIFPLLQRGNAYRAFYEVQISTFILQVIWIIYLGTLAAEIVRAIATIRMRSHAEAWEKSFLQKDGVIKLNYACFITI
ncbi:MAG TPA: hypothetical protein ENJ51_02390 [Leucothrix mucor]|uniref:Uncharacterized protein n=1 Tax=Leucothrix mucor TaxID=45248 RepID=A0A7V2T1E5_LEUMU|nr:hypothetical protein [Leucothrix mucor]